MIVATSEAVCIFGEVIGHCVQLSQSPSADSGSVRGSGASSAESFCLTTYVEGRYRDLNHTLLTVQYEKNTIVSDDHSGSTVYQKLFLRFISCHEKILVWIRCQLSIPPLCTSSAVIREQWHRDAKVLTSRPRLAASGPWKKIYAQTEAHWSLKTGHDPRNSCKS